MLNEMEKTVLQMIMAGSDISRVDISRALGISKPVVSKAVNRLIELGFVKETGRKESSSKGGRKPVLLSFVPESRYVIGVDIGGTKIDAVLTDLVGNVLNKEHILLPSNLDKRKLLELIKKVIHPFLVYERILGIGIGIPGTVDEDHLVKRIPAFDVTDWDLKEELEKTFGYPVFVENNANLDAFAEAKIGAGRGFRCVLLISVGWGIGSGIVYDGKIFRGARGKAGEFGHIVTDWSKEKEIVPEKGFGHLEEWFSGFSMSKRFGKSPEWVFEKYRDEIKESLEHFGVAVANAIVLFDPDVVIIKGGIGLHQFEKISAVVRSVVSKIVPEDILRDVEIRKGEIEEYGVAIGGALFVIENILGLKGGGKYEGCQASREVGSKAGV
ncbi:MULTISPECIES: ROK family transcriptional regulator [Thermotoga]|jgi:predicted NBD/HSP70 family sugar kinase|uniref:ROK family transcriptional regulator n=2 Tax=Thermotogaceae TaxID=188709 RepID=UPI00041DDD7D|nr:MULTISPECIES: ROK family transcriptional regulator [unclassified Thermotoga]KHC96187.1 XylR family transcriptional regulator [Thermotoga sp. Xyl54]MBZ4661330.1 XylR family transcriptional regulator [Thermotoga sp.]AIY87860.1 XylR family transcriptional regulator [Thermotoga sp. Cell2]KHC91738.1 XylR family transcriptional regulator [Thermotoga sp. TBGT1765]KHC93770.1 XylR family transcriptional regulator [Thermotoga sp. TBGT1766]